MFASVGKIGEVRVAVWHWMHSASKPLVPQEAQKGGGIPLIRHPSSCAPPRLGLDKRTLIGGKTQQKTWPSSLRACEGKQTVRIAFKSKPEAQPARFAGKIERSRSPGPGFFGPNSPECARWVPAFPLLTRKCMFFSGPKAILVHVCCWETFYMFAYCGLVVEIQPLNC